MLQPKVVLPATSNRPAVWLDRVLQALFSFVILIVVSRWILTSDPYKCAALLNQGEWLDPGRRWSAESHFKNWQAPGCMMHEYRKNDIQECFGKRRLVFVGDSTIRQIFWAVAKKMDHERADEEMAEMLDLDYKHTDLEFTSNSGAVEFIWDPFLNSSRLEHELRKFRAEPLSDNDQGEDASAGLILAGAPGLWHARHGDHSNNYFSEFRDSIERIILYMDHPKPHEVEGHSPAPRSAIDQPPNFLLIAPVQTPRYELLSPPRAETITPQKIDQMNDYLQQASAFSHADIVWSYSLMTFEGRYEYEESGIHVVENIAHRKADVLLNLRCNTVPHRYPFNRTCCSNYRKPNGAQRMIILTGLVCLPALWIARHRQIVRVGRLLPTREVFNALMTFTLVVCYCFYADRTQIFEKAQKQFRLLEFRAGCLVALAIGVISIRRAKLSAPSRYLEPGFLSRHQTEEWKGWMQAVILIYHYTHGSKSLWIYESVRVLVASYLFMSGFGHTLHFLNKEDYSFRRMASVLIRNNLLSCVLPYAMRTDYQFYYFAPLVSFWFVVIYFTMKIGRKRNSHFAFLLMKILVSGALTTAFITVPGVLESITSVLKYTCAMSWDVTEWRFRTFLDMYVVYAGMVLAILYHRSRRPHGQNHSSLLSLPSNHPRRFRLIAVVVALAALPLFAILSRVHTTKEDFNKLHPYLSWIPILAFVTLRNSHNASRGSQSRAFAWLGRCSLETYILQYHIWLAGDTTGILRTGLFDRYTDGLLLTPLFLWVSWRTARATQTLTTWIVDGSRGVIENDGQKKSPYLLPTMTPTEKGTPSKDIRVDFGGKGRLMDSLKWRLVAIGLVMWVGNMTYR